MTAALDLYAAGLAGEALTVREDSGLLAPLPVTRWLGPLTSADGRVLDRAHAPVIDIGCGPGRHVVALARRGMLAVGVDVSPAAVSVARGRGATVVEASVFDRLPGAGTWQTALLLDGNIGIGGDPPALLRRLMTILRPNGVVLAELAAPGVRTGTRRVRLEGRLGASEWFAWAAVSADDIDAVAARAGLVVTDIWVDEERWFAHLAVS